MKRGVNLLIVLLTFTTQVLIAQQSNENPKWQIVGDESFPEVNKAWYRADGIRGIGQIKSIYVEPNNKNHVIIGAFGGGIWETHNALDIDNNAVKWNSLTDDIPIHTVSRILMSDDVLYASSSSKINASFSSSHFETYGLGVVKKHKDSSRWVLPNFKFDCRYFDLFKKNGKIQIFAISKTKVYKSTDDGVTWNELESFNRVMKDKHIRLNRVLINPNNPDMIVVSAFNSKGIFYLTTDGGKTWIDQSNIFENLIQYDYQKNKKNAVIPYFDESKNKLYIALHTKSSVFVFYSKDWKSFTLHNKDSKKGLRASSMQNSSFIKLNDTDFLFGATRLHRLNNGESSQTLSANKIHDDIRDMHLYHDSKTDEKILYIGHDGGIAISRDLGKTYTNISGNLSLFQCYNMAYNNYNKHRIITIGVQDGSWYRCDRDGSNKWDAVEMCCEGGVYTEKENPNVIYLINNGRLQRLDDGLAYPLGKKQHIVKIGELDAPLAIHPTDEKIILFAKYKWPNSELYISYDKGNNMENIDIIGKGRMRGRPTAMAFNRSKPSTFYMSSLYFTPKTDPDWVVENHLYKTINLNVSPSEIVFTDIIDNIRKLDPTVLDNAVITDIEVDTDTVWISFGNVQEGKKVYYSANAGDSWQNITYNLPNSPVNCMKLSSDKSRLFAGTDEGVYQFDGNHWTPFGTGLPKTIITDLEIDTISNEIIVSTYGRGVWTADLSSSKTSNNKNTCKDLILNEDTLWTNDRSICGDLIIENAVRLTVTNANISVSNVYLKKDASLIWNGGELSAFKSLTKNQGINANMVLTKKSCSSLKNMTLKNFDIQVTKKAYLETDAISKKNSNIYFLKRSLY